MNECNRTRSEFSGYLDGAMTGAAMQRMALHLAQCPSCSEDFSGWRNAQALISSIGPAKAPADLGLRLRIALSLEAAHTRKAKLDRLRVHWQNSVKPFVLQASAGLASTVLLIGSVALLVGMFASPEPLSARDQPLGMATNPRFLYTSLEPSHPIGDRDNPVVVEAFIDGSGRVYDYKIISGATDAKTQSQLESALLFSVFEPAETFGEPVRGTVLLSFSGVAVHG
jgi:anti-sigma factor RsiW